MKKLKKMKISELKTEIKKLDEQIDLEKFKLHFLKDELTEKATLINSIKNIALILPKLIKSYFHQNKN